MFGGFLLLGFSCCCILSKVDSVQKNGAFSRGGCFADRSEKEVFETLRSSKKGLSEEEVQRRLSRYGENVMRRKKRFVWLGRVVAQIKNPIVSILLVSSIVLYLIDHAVDAHIILVVLLINVTISFFQEGKVSRAFEMLRRVDRFHALVMRDGRKIEVSANNLVPGDIVFLRAGSQVPADIRLLRENNLQINESVLTGEWAPVNKRSIALAGRKALAEQVNMAWKGTTVVTGDGCGIVVSTGERTVVGGIAKDLYESEAKTPLQQQIQKLAQWIMAFVLVSAAFIVVIGVVQGTPFADVLITGIAIAIAGIPSGLPAAITVVLVLGMQLVLRNGGLMRNMLATETLGATTWILADKTGTLTNGTMVLSEILFVDDRESVSEATISSFGRGIVFNAYLATDGQRLYREDGDGSVVFSGSAIEQSLVQACEEVCVESPTRDRRIAYVPFTSSKKYSCAVMQEQGGDYYYHIVAAPEILISKAERVRTKHGVVLLTDEHRSRLEDLFAAEAGKGRRVIAIGASKIAVDNSISEDDRDEYFRNIAEREDHEMTFLALLSLEDTVRADVPETIRRIRGAHVRLTMVTGDNQHTALHIAKRSGIIVGDDSHEVLTGEDVDALSDEAVFDRARFVRVFARMAPDQKSRLLRVLLSKKEVVAMTGDGVNDAPSLYRASIGIAVASGTDVAKEASDLVLLKNSFSAIVASIIEGRKIIKNLKKILIYLLSTSFSEAVLVAGGLLATAVLPITPVQILWANVVEESFISFAFAFEKGESKMDRFNPRNERLRNIISGDVKWAIISIALLTGLFLFGVYMYFSHFTGLSHQQIQTVMFLTVSIDSIFIAFSLKCLDKSIFSTNLFDNRWLLFSVGVSICVLALAFVIPPLATIISVVPVPLWIFWIVPVSAFFHITVVEIIKWVLFRRPLAS